MAVQVNSQPNQASQAELPPTAKVSSGSKTRLILLFLFLLIVLFFVGWKLLLPRLKKEKEITITWWGLWEDESVITPLIKEYQQNNPRVKINYIKQSPQDYRERLTNALAKGKGPDIFRFHNSWVPMFAKELDRVPSIVLPPAEYAETFYSVISSDLASGNGLVGIPLGYDALMLYVNEDILNSAGKVPPKTWDELRKMAPELTIKNDRGSITQAGVALGRTENVDHWPEILALMIFQNGGNPAKPVDQRVQDALVYFTLFSSVDGVWDETLPPSTVAFAAGKLAMMFGPSWRAFEIKEQNPNLNFKTYPLPQLPKDRPGQPDVSYATYWVEGVWSRSKNKEAAWDFLKFISSRESLQKLYQNESKVRLFGEPYPRRDLTKLMVDHPIAGALIRQASDAQSWYLQSRTFDGPTGINSLIAKYYENAINSINSGVRADRVLETLAAGVSQVLAQYGR